MNTISITPTSAEQEAKILHFLHELGIKPRVRKTGYTPLETLLNKHGDTQEEIEQEVQNLIAEGWDGSK